MRMKKLYKGQANEEEGVPADAPVDGLDSEVPSEVASGVPPNVNVQAVSNEKSLDNVMSASQSYPVKGANGGGLMDFNKRMNMMQQKDKYMSGERKEKQELIARFQAEKKRTAINKRRLQNDYRKILRTEKAQELRKEIEILSQMHERDVDKQDAIIQELSRDLEEAEEQYQMTIRSHLQNMDNLIDLQDSKLLVLENDFDSELRMLEDEFQAEKDQIVKQHKRERKELLDIMGAVESDERELAAERKQEHEQNREEIRNKNVEDINILRMTLEGNVEELEKHFESAHVHYVTNTESRTTEFQFLTQQDDQRSREMDMQVQKIEHLKEQVKIWNLKIAQNRRECEERNRALREEKDSILVHFKTLKERMTRIRDSHARRLGNLTKNAHACKTALRNKMKIAERILKLVELAGKRETEREKVLPFYVSTTATTEQEGKEDEQERKTKTATDKSSTSASGTTDSMTEGVQIATGGGESEDYEEKRLHPQGLDESGNAVGQYEYLNVFYKRSNKALLDKIAIERERDRLAQENAELKSILRQYLDGVSVNESVLEQENPLFVVNGRVKLNRRPIDEHGTGSVNVIEAATELQNIERGGRRR